MILLIALSRELCMLILLYLLYSLILNLDVHMKKQDQKKVSIYYAQKYCHVNLVTGYPFRFQKCVILRTF